MYIYLLSCHLFLLTLRNFQANPLCYCRILDLFFFFNKFSFLSFTYACVWKENCTCTCTCTILYNIRTVNTKCMYNVITLNELATYLHLSWQVSHNIALEAFMIKPSSFIGMTCTAFQKISANSDKLVHDLGSWEADPHSDQHLNFKCNTGNLNSSLVNSSTRVRQYSHEYNLSILMCFE